MHVGSWNLMHIFSEWDTVLMYTYFIHMYISVIVLMIMFAIKMAVCKLNFFVFLFGSEGKLVGVSSVLVGVLGMLSGSVRNVGGSVRSGNISSVSSVSGGVGRVSRSDWGWLGGSVRNGKSVSRYVRDVHGNIIMLEVFVKVLKT